MTLLASPIDAPSRRLDARWQRRPVVGWFVRIGSLVGPLVGSLVVAWVLTDLTPTPARTWLVVLRWVLIATTSSLVLVRLERATRRLLPIAALYDLSLAFPDRAPSRFRVALRTGTTQQLERRIAEVRSGRAADPSIGASQRVIELVASLSAHDRITRGHSERVRAYSQLVADELGLSDTERDRLRWASLLHDVGKLLVPPTLLNKSGPLTADEYELIKTHPENGRRIIEELIPWLGDAARAVWEHHERWDGTGYPRGLAGDDISLAARIVAVADAYDVMTSARSYQDPISPRAARAELARCAGTQFDPAVVRAFLNVSIGRVRRAAGPVSWAAQLAFFPTTALGSAPAAGGAVVLTGALSASSAAAMPDLPAMMFERVEAAVAEWGPGAGWERGDLSGPVTPEQDEGPGSTVSEVERLAEAIVVTPPRDVAVAAPANAAGGSEAATAPVTTIVVTLPPHLVVAPPLDTDPLVAAPADEDDAEPGDGDADEHAASGDEDRDHEGDEDSSDGQQPDHGDDDDEKNQKDDKKKKKKKKDKSDEQQPDDDEDDEKQQDESDEAGDDEDDDKQKDDKKKKDKSDEQQPDDDEDDDDEDDDDDDDDEDDDDEDDDEDDDDDDDD